MRPDEPFAVSSSRGQAGVMFAKKDVRRNFLSDLSPAMIASESNAHFDFPFRRRASRVVKFVVPFSGYFSDVFLIVGASPRKRDSRSQPSERRSRQTFAVPSPPNGKKTGSENRSA
jgi:hypothetical protein